MSKHIPDCKPHVTDALGWSAARRANVHGETRLSAAFVSVSDCFNEDSYKKYVTFHPTVTMWSYLIPSNRRKSTKREKHYHVLAVRAVLPDEQCDELINYVF